MQFSVSCIIIWQFFQSASEFVEPLITRYLATTKILIEVRKDSKNILFCIIFLKIGNETVIPVILTISMCVNEIVSNLIKIHNKSKIT